MRPNTVIRINTILLLPRRGKFCRYDTLLIGIPHLFQFTLLDFYQNQFRHSKDKEIALSDIPHLTLDNIKPVSETQVFLLHLETTLVVTIEKTQIQ